MGKTFREDLAWAIFDDEFPPMLTASERADYWARHPHNQGSRIRELGQMFRAGTWFADHVAEFNRLAGCSDSFERHAAKRESDRQNLLYWMG